ncbi:MAG: hypothetical protein FOGNACKC_04887 [Anaerolineae bacterium]|nr:hypothetical protein [Anaerolineae bacterium]
MTDTVRKPAAIFSRRVTISLYVLVAYLYWAALYVIVPTLPTYLQTKLDDLALVGLVLSMYGLWQAIVRLPVGIAADWLGRRKPFILGGFGLIALGTWLLSTADGVTGLTLARSIVGIGAGAWVPLVVAFSAMFKPAEAVRATAMLTVVLSLGRGTATLATGWLTGWGGVSAPFMVAIAAIGLAALWLLVIGEEKKPSKKPSLGETGALITRKDVLLPALLAAVCQYVDYATTFSFFPILAKTLGGTAVTQSLLVGLDVFVFLLGNLSATLLVNRIGARSMVYLNFGLLVAGAGLGALASSLALLFAAQFAIGLALGISYPVLMGMSIRFVADPERTTAMGLHQAVYAVGMFSGPWLSGILASRLGVSGMLAVTTVLVLVLGLVGTARLPRKPAG